MNLENLKIGILFAILFVLICLFCEIARAQTVRDTTLTFTSAADLNRQLVEIEGCDSVIISWSLNPDGSVFHREYQTICREVAWVWIQEYPHPNPYEYYTDTLGNEIILPGEAAVGIREESK